MWHYASMGIRSRHMSVHLSVTHQNCLKMAKLRIETGSPTKRVPNKDRIGYNSKMVQDR